MGIFSGPSVLLFFIFIIAYLASSSLVSRTSLTSLCCTALWILSFSTLNNSSKYSCHHSSILSSSNSTSPSLFLMHLISNISSDFFFLHLAIMIAVFTPPCYSKLLYMSLYAIHFALLLLSLPVYCLVCTLSCFLLFPIYIFPLFLFFPFDCLLHFTIPPPTFLFYHHLTTSHPK